MQQEAAIGEPSEHVLRVLVVDDNRDAADSLGLLLQLWGYDFRVAYDGAAALEAACAYRPDCMLLDIGLPLMDGYTVAQRVRQQPGLERVKLVALTAYSDEVHRRRAEAAGFDFHLAKPADPAELERVLKMLDEVIRLAGQNVRLAGETKQLLQEVKEDLHEVKREVKDLKDLKEEISEVKAEMRELKQELREGKASNPETTGSDG